MLFELTSAMNGAVGRVPLRSLAWWIAIIVRATLEIFQRDLWGAGDAKLFTEKVYVNWLENEWGTPGKCALPVETLEFIAPRKGLTVTLLVIYTIRLFVYCVHMELDFSLK